MGVLVDVMLVLLLAVSAVGGWRRGLVLSVCAITGLVGGAALAMWLAPMLVERVTPLQGSLPLRVLTLSLAVLLGATIGQGLLGSLGRTFRHRAHRGPVRVLDGAVGALASLVVTAALVWFAADTVRLAAPGDPARAVAASQVLRGIDAVMPAGVGRSFADFRNQVQESEFPRVFEGLAHEPIADTQPPDPRVARTRGVVAAAAGIVKVTGDAGECHREQDGSGWVSARERVITNAHVVAGTDQVRVQVGGKGKWYTSTVVAYDPHLDLAVLRVPGLPASPLPTATLADGAQGVVAGFPGGGGYHLGAARVRQVVAARGADIYGGRGVVRQVYSLYATVRPGNSGGPLLTTDGRVAGTVFAQSVDDPSTGYALTSQATAPMVADAPRRTDPVGTGACTTQ